MSRNMITANSSFFKHVLSMMDEDVAEKVSSSKRYIATNDEDKNWLQNLNIGYSFRIARDAYALLLYLKSQDYLCLINIEKKSNRIPFLLEEILVNAGLITVLGSEGYLTPKVPHALQLRICDEVMYDTKAIDYHGHQWEDIKMLFPTVYCYKINLENEDVDIRENINLFYQILCQIIFEFDAGNNPYTNDLKSIWEKIFYEGTLSKINYKSLLMSYIALTWDISYLYLYQCIEDKFACNSVRSLHKRLGVEIPEQDLSRVLYEELSWQPRDLEGIESIIKECSNSLGIDLLKELALEEGLAKYIYSIRNSIVHETKAAKIPLEDNSKWEKLIKGILYILMDI
jgi:hypothetical protein